MAFGACIGSFLNVVIYRLPRGNFFAEARSYCPGCGHRLNADDLIPILSYVLLRGRCRYCSVRISPRYPCVEAACALLAVLCYARFGMHPKTIIAFGVTAILLAIAIIDADTMTIPDALNIALVPFATAAAFVLPEAALMARAAGFLAVSLPLLIIALIIPDAFGGGDIKLMAVCGFLLGWQHILTAFFIAVLSGGGYASYLLLSGKSKRGAHIAFGPHLCLGISAALFMGSEIIAFYINFLIL